MKVPVYPYIIKAYYKSGATCVIFRKSPKIPVSFKRENPVRITVRQVFTDELSQDDKEWMEIDTRLWDERMWR